MIVDDEPANLRLLERLFRQDYKVITAESGEEALRLLAQHDTALLITDQRMPSMSGLELLKQTAELRPHMVRMILTGFFSRRASGPLGRCPPPAPAHPPGPAPTSHVRPRSSPAGCPGPTSLRTAPDTRSTR